LLAISVLTLALRTTAASISNASAVFVYNDEQSNEQFVFAYAVDSTGNDIYIHMSAPAGNAWMAVGAGSSMKDTLMLIAYASKNGTGMTLSPRIATGHSEPSYTDKVSCVLVYADDLENGNTVTNYGYQGSGLLGTMTVNAVCHNATTDQSKSPLIAGFPVGASDDMSPFIFAVGPGTVGNNNLQSNSLTASLREHDFYGQFSMNATAATAPTGSQAQVPRPNTANNNYTLANADAAYATHADNDPAPIIHAGVMCITFVFIYPLGAMLLRILNKVKSHAVIQCIGLVLTTMATAGGIVISSKYNKSKNFNSAHQVIGILIFLALWAQLTLGILNHRTFKKTGQKTTMGKVHLYLGPAVILLGWINAPLGFVFGGNPHACLPYIVILLAVIMIYISL
ncbi:CBD9-like protein, partial [Teratosphaeria nubilosa]